MSLKKAIKDRTKRLTAAQVDRKIAKRILRRLRKGDSINITDYGKTYIDNFLVQLDSAEKSFKKVIETYDEIEEDSQWIFVVGNYGSGKTQLKDRIEAYFQYEKNKYLIIESANMEKDSITEFCDKIVASVQDLLANHHNLSLPKLADLFTSYDRERDSTSKVRLVSKVMKRAFDTCRFKFLIQIDEIDRIFDFEAFIPWASLFANLNNQVEEGFLGIIYIAEREINRYWNKDRRLDRLNNFLLKRLNPGSRFGSQYKEGFANIVSIYQLAYRDFHERTIDILLEDLLEFQKDRLANLSLRQFNTNAYSICELLSFFEKDGLWDKVEQTSWTDKTAKGQQAEKSLINILNKKEFFLTVEQESYIATILNERLPTAGSGKSDGRIKLEKEEEGEQHTIKELPIEIKFTTGTQHEDSQLRHVERTTQYSPTVFLSIGPNQTHRDGMRRRFKDLLDQDQLVIVDIDKHLFDPIFVNLDKDDDEYRQYLQNWLFITSHINSQLRLFFERLLINDVKQEFEKLKLEMEKLKTQFEVQARQQTSPGAPVFSPGAIGRTPVPSSVVSATGSPASVAGSGTNAKNSIAFAIITLFTQNSRKFKKSLPNHIKKLLKNDTPANLDEIYTSILDDLVARNYLSQSSSGSSFTRTAHWNDPNIQQYMMEIN